MSNAYFNSQPTRPAIISAIGVASIIIASVSLIADLGSLIVSSVATRMSMVTAHGPVANNPISPPPPAAVQTHSEYVGPQGLSASQRKIVIDGLSSVRPLNDERQKQLDALLADVGQNVIRLSPENLTAERVATYVTDVREMPSGSGSAPDDMFILGSGRLQLSDQSAAFFADNSPSPIRSRGGSYSDSDGTHMAAEQIAAIVDRVQALCNQAMNVAQVKSLELQLESTQQTLITPSPSVTQAVAQVTSVQTLPDGTVAVTTSSGSMSFTPQGQSWPGIMAGAGMAGPWGGPMAGPATSSVVRRDAVLLMLDTLLCFLAAGFLMACGIMTFRNSPASRWMHIGWAVAKIFLAVLSCYAIYAIAAEMDAGSPDVQSTAVAWMIIVGAVGFIYPVVILVVMNVKVVKEFFGTATVSRIF